MKTTGHDLEERTAVFGEATIEFCLALPTNPATAPIINQLVRAGTSVGANYCEADDAESKKDFRHKVALCRKEARETKSWLRMIAKAAPAKKAAARILWKEAKELYLIFVAIIRTTDRILRAAQSAKPDLRHSSLDIGH
ncbi:MAG: four helix bundle protein [Opitutus sp.]|nr:four helix bundle protein [Opitutus sp.]